MKIAYVYDAVYPWVKGGAEKRVYEISRRLAERGHDVHWFGLNWWDGAKHTTIDNIYLHGVGRWNSLYANGRRSIQEAIYYGLKILMELRADFDVIDCQEFPYFPCFSAKTHSLLDGSDLIITWHEIWGDYWFEYLGKKGIFGWTVEKLTCRLASRNIAVSQRAKSDLQRTGVKGTVEVIPNGIDLKKIQEAKPSEEESDVIFVGRLIKEKNVSVLVRAMQLVREEIPDVKCMIIGDGPEKGKLEKLAHRLKMDGNIKFTGFLKNHDDVISYLKSSKVFVLPSTREGFGIAALEANACSLPVITVNHEKNAACDLIVGSRNGFICELSERDIAEKIVEVLEKKDFVKDYIENAKHYDWDNIARVVEDFYEA